MKKESNHNALIAEFQCKVNNPKSAKKSEVYNIKNTECQKEFLKYTSNTKMLSNILNSKDDINTLTKRFTKKIDGCIKSNFRRVRVKKNKELEQEKLYKKLKILKEKYDEKSKDEAEKVEEAIANAAEAEYLKVMEELNKMKPEEGRIDSQKF